jgi:hypothetical protein
VPSESARAAPWGRLETVQEVLTEPESDCEKSVKSGTGVLRAPVSMAASWSNVVLTHARIYRDFMSLTDWASQVARDKLESLPSRWAHVQGVARQARTLRGIAGQDADLLEAAAVLHDVGYAPDLAVTGFHPLDGASFLADLGAPARLVNLVAHHSYALLEAELRGLADEMTRFHDEQGLIRDALWYCDQTTSPHGEPVSQRHRIAEIHHRYGSGHLVSRFIREAEPELTAAVQRTEQRMAAATAPQPR